MPTGGVWSASGWEVSKSGTNGGEKDKKKKKRGGGDIETEV